MINIVILNLYTHTIVESKDPTVTYSSPLKYAANVLASSPSVPSSTVDQSGLIKHAHLHLVMPMIISFPTINSDLMLGEKLSFSVIAAIMVFDAMIQVVVVYSLLINDSFPGTCLNLSRNCMLCWLCFRVK